MRRVVALGTVVVALVAMLAMPAASSAETVKTVAKIRGRAIDFAQDGRYMAWYSKHTTGCPVRIILFDVPRLLGQQVRCTKQVGSQSLSKRDVGVTSSGQVVWNEVRNNSRSVYMRVFSDTLSSNPKMLQENVYSTPCKSGNWFQALGADQDTFVWTTRVFDAVLDGGGDCTGDGTPISGFTYNTNAGLASVIGFGTPGADLIAVRNGRFAIPVNGDDDISVRNSRTGAVITTVDPGAGDVQSIAMGGSYLAALIKRPNDDLEIQRWNSTDGTDAGTSLLPDGSSGPISTNGKWVTFRKGLNVRKLRISNGLHYSVATLKRAPVGLHIDARRMAWIQPLGSGRFAVQYAKVL